VAAVLHAHRVPSEETELTVDDVLAADAWARAEAAGFTDPGDRTG
jgi:1-deoxy-D-xylulose-5-phosphate reductoisomerase